MSYLEKLVSVAEQDKTDLGLLILELGQDHGELMGLLRRKILHSEDMSTPWIALQSTKIMADLVKIMINLGYDLDDIELTFRENVVDYEEWLNNKNAEDITHTNYDEETYELEPKEEVRLVLNRMQCSNCGDILTSHGVHDYVTCSCHSLSIDGGTDYQRYIIDDEHKPIDLSVYSDAPFEVIRKSFHRGGRGKDGKQPLTWTPMCEMNDEWLEACIEYNNDRNFGDSFANKMYRKELEYRLENNIIIKE